MKAKDFFNKLKTDGKITDEDFVKFIDTLPDIEIPDTAVTAFERSFLTPERAITHNEVRRHPGWREEPSTPVPSPKLPQRVGTRLLGIVVVLIVVAAIALLILKGWALSLRD